MANPVLLKVNALKVAYGGIQAVKGVSFEVRQGELVSLIGANGAGKTTTLKAVTGLQPVAAGDIEFMGKSIKGQGAWDLVKQGLVMVPEGRGCFTRMTITENLLMGAFVRNDNEIEADIDKVFAIFPRLKERRAQLSGTMSGGEQQMLAMGRALMARPKVLLLDEPSMGLSPIMVDKIFEVVSTIHGQGTTVLKLAGLRVAYGGIQAVKGVDLEIREGELVTLIGANGAGKTTTLKAITGTQAWAGTIEYLGESTQGKAPHQLLRRGLVMVPEGRGVFTRMTVTENLQMGAFARDDTAGIAEDMERMFATFPRLKERARQLAGTLSGGEQQMLAMARAMMSRPRLLLLDEPSMGLSPIMVEKIFDVVRSVAAQKIPMLLVEQNARLALEAAHRAYVMDSGLVTLSGDARQMLSDPKVRAAYLGEAAA